MRAYHPFPVTEDDITKTAINTPFGLYEFCRIYFLVSEMLLKPFSGLLMVYVMIWTLSWSISIISWLLALL